MKSALNKDFIRDILKSKGRFISILAIVALGVAFFTGIKSAPIVMQKSSDKYYDDYNLMDIRLVSTLGLTDKDVKEIKKIDNIDGIYPTHSMDVISTYDSNEEVLKVHGLDINNMDKKNNNYINQLKLIEGRLPQKSGECVIDQTKFNGENYPIGSKISLSSGTKDELSDSLEMTEYTVVGYVRTPYYLSHEKGNSSIGSGVVSGAIMIPEEDFKTEVFTEIFLTVKGAKALDTYSEEYFDLVESVIDEVEKIKDVRADERYDEVIKEASDKLKEAEEKLEEGKIDLEKGKKEYEENKIKAQKKLEDAQNQINSYIKQIEDGENQLELEELKAKQQIEDGQKRIKEAEESLKSGEAQYEKALEDFNSKKSLAQVEIEKAENQLENLNTQIKNLKDNNKSIEQQLENQNLSSEEREKLEGTLKQNIYILATLEDNYNSGNKELQGQKQALIDGENKLKETKDALDTSKKQLEEEKITLEKSKYTVEEKFEVAKSELKEKKLAIDDAQEELNENKITVEAELIKAEQKLIDGEEELKDGQKEIEDGKKDIEKIEKPTWYILDRNSHQSFAEYKGCSESIDALAKIFPVFFFAVAALVCLTTMTRMVDEQRINIGTLKGLGYKTGQISKKYILYAFSACMIGCILGTIIGYILFPSVIFFSYGMMYYVPNIIFIFSLPITLGITLVALIIIISSSYLACRNELKESPVILMRPRPPKNGKRILLEKIPFIWDKLSFISKVTIRNIFRYKKRFFMTVLGISGCTALIVTGFGVKDSIEIIVSGQYGTLFKYDMSVVIDSNMSDKEIVKLTNELSHFDEIKEYNLFSYENGDIKVDNISKEITIVVPQDLGSMDEFIHLQDRKTQESIKLDDSGVVISEKIANDLDIKVGDSIDLINSKDKKSKIKVIGITENYISHYAYISPSKYKELFNNKLSFNRVLGILNNPNVEMENDLSKKLSKIEHLNGSSFNTAAKETFQNTIKNLNYVVMIMILSAGSLAFVVLYNLTNVNISERIREIATIKVLGFYDSEVSKYIYRENIILSLIGTLVGLGLGKILHQFIMVTVEIQSMMFGRVISTKSYIIAAVLTIVLSCIVNISMYYKLKNVKMVESLKSVD